MNGNGRWLRALHRLLENDDLIWRKATNEQTKHGKPSRCWWVIAICSNKSQPLNQKQQPRRLIALRNHFDRHFEWIRHANTWRLISLFTPAVQEHILRRHRSPSSSSSSSSGITFTPSVEHTHTHSLEGKVGASLMCCTWLHTSTVELLLITLSLSFHTLPFPFASLHVHLLVFFVFRGFSLHSRRMRRVSSWNDFISQLWFPFSPSKSVVTLDFLPLFHALD